MHKVILSIGIFCVVLFLFISGIDHFSSSTSAKQKESLEKAIQRDITTCYAMEGKYPDDLAYLKENYGLLYDESQFYVDYRNIGSNIYPDVTILEKGDEK